MVRLHNKTKIMKKLLLLSIIALSLYACSNNGSSSTDSNANTGSGSSSTSPENATANSANPSYDPKRGEGKFTKVDLSEKLDAAMATNGEKVYGVKCSSCHKTTDEKLVGPGWKGVTGRNTPEWIMNFVTNTDAMLDKDPKAQAQLEICLVRMPNQNLADEEARSLLEFMRKNDGVK